jgi:hypothetical protein
VTDKPTNRPLDGPTEPNSKTNPTPTMAAGNLYNFNNLLSPEPAAVQLLAHEPDDLGPATRRLFLCSRLTLGQADHVVEICSILARKGVGLLMIYVVAAPYNTGGRTVPIDATVVRAGSRVAAEARLVSRPVMTIEARTIMANVLEPTILRAMNETTKIGVGFLSSPSPRPGIFGFQVLTEEAPFLRHCM